jgi:hypothetical protein
MTTIRTHLFRANVMASVTNQISRERAEVSSASRFRGSKPITSSTAGFARGTVGKLIRRNTPDVVHPRKSEVDQWA